MSDHSTNGGYGHQPLPESRPTPGTPSEGKGQ